MSENPYDVFDLGYDKNLDRSDTSSIDQESLNPSDLIDSSTLTDYSGGILDVTGTILDPSTISSGSLGATLEQNASGILFSGKTSFIDTTNGYRLGIDPTTNTFKFIMGTTGSMIDWNVTTANTLTISGTVAVIAGSIAGLTITATALTTTSGGNSTIISSSSTAFSAGPTGSPTFTVTQAGILTATGVNISGTLTTSAITVTGGTIRYQKTSFTDSINAGYYIGSEGIYVGAASDASKLKYTISDGSFDLIGTISSRSTVTIAAAINSSGNLVTDIINARLDSSAKNMLAGFTFGVADYSGALSSGTITWNTTTGALTGGSGVLVYRGGILGAAAGLATFTLDSATGSLTLKGAVTATSGSITGAFSILGALTIGTAGSISSGQTNYNTGTGYWFDYNSGSPRFSIGDATYNFITWDNTTFTVSGNIALVDSSLIAGHALDAGIPVVVSSSDNKVYHTRINDISSRDISSTTAATFSATGDLAHGPIRYIELSSGLVVVSLSSQINGGATEDSISIEKLAFSPSVTTSLTRTSILNSGSAARGNDMCKLSSTSVAFVTMRDSDLDFDANIITAIDTTPVVANGGSATVLASAITVTSIGCASYSSTKFVAAYTKSGSNVVFFQPPTISAGVVVAGSDTSLFTPASAPVICGIGQFGDSQAGGTLFYLIVYAYGGNSFCRVIQFDGTTFTVGSEVSFASGVTIRQNACFAYSDTSTLVVAYNDATNQKLVCVTRSSTTPTVNTAVTMHAVVGAQDTPSVYRFSKYTFTAGSPSSAGVTKFYIFDLDGTTLTQLGSVFSCNFINNNTMQSAILAKWNAETGLMYFMDGTAAGTTFSNYYSSTLANNYSQFVGISVLAAAKNATIPITFIGTNTAVTGLTAGTTYYTDCETTSSLDLGNQRVGIAVSSTKIIVK